MSASAILTDTKRKGLPNARLYRHWSESSEIVRGAIDIRKGDLENAEWDIVPFDPSRPYPRRIQRELRDLFENPNPLAESFQEFIGEIGEDIMVLDAGAIEIERTFGGRPTYLWPTPGEQIYVDPTWDGDEKAARYFFRPDHTIGNEDKGLLNEDLIYIMSRPRTKSSVGLCSLEVLKRVIDAEILGTDYNARQVGTATGDGIFDLGENAREAQVDRFKSYWLNDVAGKGATAFWGGTRGAKWIPFRNNNRDMQFLEWQIYLAKKTALVFGLHPQDLGITDSVNKATAQVLDEQSDERGARRMLRLVQAHLTKEVVWDDAFGGQANNLAFRFTKLNLKRTLKQAQIEEIQTGKVATRAVNEIRIERGEAPFPQRHFNFPMAQTAVGFVSLEDVPTAREMMESKETKEPEAPPPSGDGEKAMLPAVMRLELPEGLMQQREIPLLETGAVQVDVHVPPAPEPVKPGPKTTTFIYGEDGRVEGKREVEG